MKEQTNISIEQNRKPKNRTNLTVNLSLIKEKWGGGGPKIAEE